MEPPVEPKSISKRKIGQSLNSYELVLKYHGVDTRSVREWDSATISSIAWYVKALYLSIYYAYWYGFYVWVAQPWLVLSPVTVQSSPLVLAYCVLGVALLPPVFYSITFHLHLKYNISSFYHEELKQQLVRRIPYESIPQFTIRLADTLRREKPPWLRLSCYYCYSIRDNDRYYDALALWKIQKDAYRTLMMLKYLETVFKSRKQKRVGGMYALAANIEFVTLLHKLFNKKIDSTIANTVLCCLFSLCAWPVYVLYTIIVWILCPLEYRSLILPVYIRISRIVQTIRYRPSEAMQSLFAFLRNHRVSEIVNPLGVTHFQFKHRYCSMAQGHEFNLSMHELPEHYALVETMRVDFMERCYEFVKELKNMDMSELQMPNRASSNKQQVYKESSVVPYDENSVLSLMIERSSSSINRSSSYNNFSPPSAVTTTPESSRKSISGTRVESPRGRASSVTSPPSSRKNSLSLTSLNINLPPLSENDDKQQGKKEKTRARSRSRSGGSRKDIELGDVDSSHHLVDSKGKRGDKVKPALMNSNWKHVYYKEGGEELGDDVEMGILGGGTNDNDDDNGGGEVGGREGAGESKVAAHLEREKAMAMASGSGKGRKG